MSAPKSLALAKIWLNYQEKASFSLILTKSIGPIFESAEPMERHRALEGALVCTKLNAFFMLITPKYDNGIN